MSIPADLDRYVSSRIVLFRVADGLSQRQLAIKVGVPPCKMCRLEAGKSPIAVTLIWKIGKVLNRQFKEFLPDV